MSSTLRGLQRASSSLNSTVLSPATTYLPRDSDVLSRIVLASLLRRVRYRPLALAELLRCRFVGHLGLWCRRKVGRGGGDGLVEFGCVRGLAVRYGETMGRVSQPQLPRTTVGSSACSTSSPLPQYTTHTCEHVYSTAGHVQGRAVRAYCEHFAPRNPSSSSNPLTAAGQLTKPESQAAADARLRIPIPRRRWFVPRVPDNHSC